MASVRTLMLASGCTLLTIVGCGDDSPSGDAGTQGSSSDSGDDSSSLGVVEGSSSSDGPSPDSSGDTSGGPTGGGSSSESGGESDSGSTGSSSGDPSSSGSSSSEDSSSTTSSEAIDATIYDIQDGTIAEGTAVSVTGVVITAVHPAGVFVQEPPSGEHSGVFAYTGPGGTTGLLVGDHVDVVGTTAEVLGQTQIQLDAPVDVIENDIAPDPELLPAGALDAAGSAEPWEGVLVRIEGVPLTVTAIEAFDEFTVDHDGTDTRIDDLLYTAVTDTAAFPGFAVDATFTAIVGPVSYSSGLYKIAPREAADLANFVPPPPPPPIGIDEVVAGDLVVTEVMFDPTCPGDACEWIEVLNLSGEWVQLSGLIIQDASMDTGAQGEIVDDVLVPPDALVLLGRGDGSAWPYATIDAQGYYGALLDLDDDADTVVLRNAAGIIDATATWTGQGTDDDGSSWRLAPTSLNATANDQPTAWCFSPVVFENVAGVDEFGTPGSANLTGCAAFGAAVPVADLLAGDLVVTEIMYDPNCANDACEWVEIFNATGQTVNLDGLVLEDLANTQGTIAGETLLAPAGFGVLAKGDGSAFPYTTFTPLGFYGNTPAFNNSGGDLLRLLTPQGDVIDETGTYVAQGAADNGVSWKLDPSATDAVSNDDEALWCWSPDVFESPGGIDEYGSPAAPNPAACNPL